MPSGCARIRWSSPFTTTVDIAVRDLRPEDWPQVAAVYEDGIRTGNATFETGVPSWEAWDAAHSEHRLVAEIEGKVAGWAALSAYSDRCCYRGVAENSVYVGEWARGRGVGRLLLEELIARSEADGIWTLQAGIFPENQASVRLHLVCGFRLVGVRERFGFTPVPGPRLSSERKPRAESLGPGTGVQEKLDGRWRDVLLLERRSELVG